MDPTVSRRAVLAVGVAGAGAAALAACSSNKKGSGTTQTSQPVDKSVAKLADIPVGQAVSASLPVVWRGVRGRGRGCRLAVVGGQQFGEREPGDPLELSLAAAAVEDRDLELAGRQRARLAVGPAHRPERGDRDGEGIGEGLPRG